MDTVTLFEQDRFSPVSKLPKGHYENIISCIGDIYGDKIKEEVAENKASFHVRDLESMLHINYVDRDRDLHSVVPIESCQYFVDYDRQKLAPLLEALSVGDFDLASALTPYKRRLCGYQEFKEARTIEEHGATGWAGQYAVVEVPAGIYPVFASEFRFHESRNCFTNQLKDYPGLTTWLEGQCIASSSPHETYPHPYVLVQSPYSHAVAKDIIMGTSDIRLVAPFKAEAIPVKWVGEELVSTYSITDMALPKLVNDNPLFLRGSKQCAPSLDSMIESAHPRIAVRTRATKAHEKDSFFEK